MIDFWEAKKPQAPILPTNQSPYTAINHKSNTKAEQSRLEMVIILRLKKEKKTQQKILRCFVSV